MTKEAMKLAQKWQQTDWNTENPMSADFAVSEAHDVISALIDALREALAEQPAQQEPVGYVAENGLVDWNGCAPPILTDLYTSPQRTWVGLTEVEADKIYKDGSTFGEMMRMVEAKLKEKNT